MSQHGTLSLGYVSAILPDESLESCLTLAGEIGYSCVEVMCWPVSKAERRYAGITHIDVTDFSQAQADDANAIVEKSGVAISGLGFYPNPLAPDQVESDASVAHIQKVIQATAKLGLSTMNTFIGRDWTKSVDDNWPRFLEVWKPLIQFAEDNGV